MPSPSCFAGHFQYIMRQKCSRKLFILTISLVFSVSYSVPKRKKNTRTTKTGHKQRARPRPLRPGSYVELYMIPIKVDPNN